MKTFEYKGFDRQGKTRKGLIEALDPKEAREKLVVRGILPENVRESGQDPSAHPLFRRPFSTAFKAVFYRELAALCQAGLTLTRSLDLLIESPEITVERSLLAAVRDRIKQGKDLAEALSICCPRVTTFETSALQAGQHSGKLGLVCDQLADYYELQGRMQESICTALVYPTLVVILSFFVVTGMLGFMLTTFNSLLREMEIATPAITRLVLFGARWGLAALPMVLLLLALGWRWTMQRRRHEETARENQDRLLFRLPVIGKIYLLLVNLRYAGTWRLLIQGGVDLVEGMVMAGRATGNRWIENQVLAQVEEIKRGGTFAGALRAIPPLAYYLPGWVEAGDESNNIGGLLENAIARLEFQWKQSLERALRILEPMILVVVGLFVFLIALAILQPIMALNRSLAQ